MNDAGESFGLFLTTVNRRYEKKLDKWVTSLYYEERMGKMHEHKCI